MAANYLSPVDASRNEKAVLSPLVIRKGGAQRTSMC